jgi:hypothetical protein
LEAAAQLKSGNTAPGHKGAKTVSLDEALGILMSGFLRGGGAGFLKGTGEIIKGTSAVSREVRVGVTHVSTCKYYLHPCFLFINLTK